MLKLSNIKDEKDIYKNFVDGQWVYSSNKKTIEIKSPIDKEIIGEIQSITQEEVDNIIESSIKAQKKWPEVPIYERANILTKASNILEENLDYIANILVKEICKDKKSAIAEIKRTVDFIRFTVSAGVNIEGKSSEGDNFPGGNNKKISIIKRVPVGVVLAISPFNYPINLSAAKIVPALMAGNSVILKPATQGAISALNLVEIFNLAGLPKGVLNTVTGKGSEIGDYIVSHKGINFINFTGSTEVGKHISKIASMVPQIMELGGKDAAIVLEDADMKKTAKDIISGAFSYSGQRCTAIKRVLGTKVVLEKLIPLLIEEIEKLKVGNPEDNSDIVPLIDESAAGYVKYLIDEAVSRGAKVLTGYKIEKNLIYPTLLVDVKRDMKIAIEEPFGPVLPIIEVKDIEEAVEIANESEYGLQSSIFTKDIDNAFLIAKKLEVGTVQINGKTERGPDHLPFIGIKSSGIGIQGIKYSIESMTRLKIVSINLKND